MAKPRTNQFNDAVAEMEEQQQSDNSNRSFTSNSKKKRKDKQSIFSFWSDCDKVSKWKAYQEANKELATRADLGERAIEEYIKNHPLEGDELKLYELLAK